MKKVFAWLIAMVICLPAVLALTALFAVNNSAATAWLLQRAGHYMPGTLVLEGIQGELATGLSIGSISYTLPDIRVEATAATIVIDWLWLLESRLYFDRLTAGHLVISLAGSDTQANDASLPSVDLPLAITVNNLQLKQFDLTASGVNETLHDVSGRAKYSDTRIEVASLTAKREALTASLAGNIRLAGAYPLIMQIDWNNSEPPISGSGTLQGDLETLLFEQRLNVPEEILLSGTLHSVTREPTFDATAKWEQLTLPDGAEDSVTLTAGQAKLSGSASQFQLEINSTLTVPSLPTLAASIVAAGNLEQLEILQLSVTGFDGRIDGTGRIAIPEQLLALQLEGRNLNPATVIAGLPGRLNTRTSIEARLPNRFAIDIQSVSGILLEQSLAGSASLTLADERLTISGLRLTAGDNRLSFNGEVLPELTGRFSVDAGDLSQLLPALRGQISGAGEIYGTLAQPIGQVSLQASDIFYREQGAAQVLVDARIDAEQNINASISAGAIQSGEILIGDLTTTVNGTLTAQTAHLELQEGAVGLVMDANGGWDGRLLRYQLNTAEVDTGIAGVWRLRSPFDVSAFNTFVELSAHCWEQADAELCLNDSKIDDGELEVAGRLVKLPLTTFQPWIVEGFIVSGTADANFDLRRRNGEFKGFLGWSQNDTRISFNDSEDTTLETGLEELSLQISGTDQKAEVSGRIRSELGITVNLAASLTDLLEKSASVDGRLLIDAPDISESAVLINRFFEVQQLNGRLTADLRMTGRLDGPRISGNGGILNGSAYLPQTGITLESLQFGLTGRNDSPVRLTASAESGGGSLSIDGFLDVSEQTGPFAEISIRGDNFQIIRLPNQTVHISPNLQSRIDEGRIDMSGSVQVPNAEILIDALPESAAAPSTDVVIETLEAEQPTRQAPIEFVGEIELQLGDNVHFSGFGIDTRLAGGLKLSRTMGAVNTFAEGNLRTVDGQFEAYRKKLTIDRGTLIFSGPLNDPSIDARTSRQIDYKGETITVGVMLTGPISNLRTRLFSEPAMNEADTLSFLVLNRPISLAEDDEADDLSNAAIAFGVSQALPMTQVFQETLGIDEVSMEGDTTESTAIAAGKRLTKDMDIRYSYGLFNRIGTFIVRYDLKRGFVIEAGSGEEQTLDLIYTIKR